MALLNWPIDLFRSRKVDGAGINHPRGAGIATHMGVALDVPTIGITKKILCGKSDGC